MQASFKPRNYAAYECDHMRPKIMDDDGVWRHIFEGRLAGECVATTYKVTATYTGEHYIVDAVDPDDTHNRSYREARTP